MSDANAVGMGVRGSGKVERGSGGLDGVIIEVVIWDTNENQRKSRKGKRKITEIERSKKGNGARYMDGKNGGWTVT